MELEKFGVQVTISSRLRRHEFVMSLVALSNFLDFHGGELPRSFNSPVIDLVSGQSSTVYSTLLTSAYADHLSVFSVDDRVTLRVLQRNGGNCQVSDSELWELKQKV